MNTLFLLFFLLTILLLIYLLAYSIHVIKEERKLLIEMEKLVSNKKEVQKPIIPLKVFIALFLRSFIPTKGETIVFLIVTIICIPLILKYSGIGLLLWAGIMVTVIYARFSSSVKVTSSASLGGIFMGNTIRTEYDIVIDNRKTNTSNKKLFQGGVITYFLLIVVVIVFQPIIKGIVG